MKFAEYVTKWKIAARLKISDGWKIHQDQILEQHILPFLANVPLRKITPEIISTVIQASKDKGHSPNTTKKIYMVMSKIFKDAVQFFELIERSPVKKHFHKPEIPPMERPYLTYEQSLVVLEYVMHHPLFGDAVWIQILAGLRVSEVQGLKWEDIDFKDDLIIITRKYNKITGKMDGFTKSKTHHTVPLCGMLKRHLLPKKGEGFICKSSTGGMMNHDGYKTWIRRLSKKLKLSITASHGFRHSCARLYKEFGATDEMIQQLLGHKSIISTQTYLHKDLKNLIDLAKKIA